MCDKECTSSYRSGYNLRLMALGHMIHVLNSNKHHQNPPFKSWWCNFILCFCWSEYNTEESTNYHFKMDGSILCSISLKKKKHPMLFLIIMSKRWHSNRTSKYFCKKITYQITLTIHPQYKLFSERYRTSLYNSKIWNTNFHTILISKKNKRQQNGCHLSVMLCQGKGIGGFHFENSTNCLFTKDPLCNQNVSVDWWNCRTFLWSSHRIPCMVEQGSESEA